LGGHLLQKNKPGPPLVVVPVVPRNHWIFQKALRNHWIFENICLERGTGVTLFIDYAANASAGTT